MHLPMGTAQPPLFFDTYQQSWTPLHALPMLPMQDYISHVNMNASARGNCSYAQGALMRLAYDQRCRSVEQEDGLSGMMQVCGTLRS
jgi:hypothetical protein